MASAVVEDVRLVEVAGHTYRQRTQLPGTRDRGRPTARPQQQQADWSAEDMEELEILTMEDAQDAELAHISEESDGSFVSQIDLDPQVGGQEVPEVTASAMQRLTHCCVHCSSCPSSLGGAATPKSRLSRRPAPHSSSQKVSVAAWCRAKPNRQRQHSPVLHASPNVGALGLLCSSRTPFPLLS